MVSKIVGEPWPIAIGLGSLMQTKGLMEVVILTIFRENGLMSAQIFSALILMSLVCTALTMPLTNLALGRRAAAGSADDTWSPPSTSRTVRTPKKRRRRPGPTPARQRVANPRQGDFAKPDCEE
jgi:hypothetical protein